MESTERAAQEKSRNGSELPERGVEYSQETLDAAFSEALGDVGRESAEVAVGHLKVERVASERGGTLLPDERTENDAIAAEAAGVVATQRQELTAWADSDVTPSSEASQNIAEALALSKATLEGKAMPGTEPEIHVDVEIPTDSVADMTKEEIQNASLAMETSMPDHAGAKYRMDVNRGALIDAQNALKKFEGLGAVRAWTAAGKAERKALQESLRQTKDAFEKSRGEYVGADAMRLLDLRLQQAKDDAAKIAMEKGFLSGGLESMHDVYKKLGDYNLSRLTGYVPDNRVGRAAMRMASARTLVTAGLLGVGVFMGAGSAVGFGAIATRRLLSGVGASAGSYDLMKMYADRSLDSFKPTMRDLETMSDAVLLEKLEKLEARALLAGKSLDTDPVYMQVRDVVGKRLEAAVDAVDSEEDGQAILELFAGDRDTNVASELKSRSRKETAMKIGAVGIGTFIGSGTMARMFGETTRWAFSGGSDVASASEVRPSYGAGIAADAQEKFVRVADEAPAAEVAPATGAVDALSEVRKGDGYVKIFARQMEADPAKYGFDASQDGDAHKWAMKMANKVAKEQGLMSKGLAFDAENPGHVRLNADFTVESDGAKEVVRAPRVVVAEADAAPADAAPVKQDVLSHVETYVDADGTPYYQHDWKQFKFDPGIPENVREEVARSIDLHGKQIQAMTGMMDDARAKYGKEAWFNKFDLMMQKQIRGSYVDWRHEMRQAAGVDKGVMYVNEAVRGGDPKKAAEMVFESTRLAGGFPTMDIHEPSAISKAIDAVTGTAETAAPIDSVRVSNGMEVQFLHDAAGNVTGYEMAGNGMMNVDVPLLRKDFMRIMMESGHTAPIEITHVQLASARIEMARQTYEAMRADGKATTPEAKFLLKVVRNGMATLEKRYPGVTIRSQE